MAKSCKGLALELAKCLSDSPCIKEEKRTYKDCAREKAPSVPSACVGLRETYFQCKRGQIRERYLDIAKDGKLVQVDMTKRIRGNKGY